MPQLNDVINIGGRGIKARRQLSAPLLALTCTALAGIWMFNASPALAHNAMTALLVIEYEVRAAFCVVKGIVPSKSCKKPGFSRLMSIIVIAASAALAFAITGGLELLLGCSFNPMQYLLPPLGPVVAGTWTCD